MALENLHITLVFLGLLNGEQQKTAEAVASRTCFENFVLTLDKSGFWSGPRVAWLGTGQVSAGLTQLERDLRQQLTAARFRLEQRPYVPHLTVVRKVGRAAEMFPFQSVAWPVFDFALVASVPATTGVRYEVIRSWPSDVAGVSAHLEAR